MIIRIIFLCIFLLSHTVYAESKSVMSSAADALLDSVASPEVKEKSDSAPLQKLDSFMGLKTDDPFLVKLYSSWRSQNSLLYDVNLWVRMILSENFVGAAHLWSAVEKKIPESFLVFAQAAELYNLWKLDIPQTFFNEWIRLLRNERFRAAPLTAVLHDRIRPAFDQWILKSALSPSSELENLLKDPTLQSDFIFETLRTWMILQNPQNRSSHELSYILARLEALSANHALALPLARLVALDYAKNKDLPKAALILKKVVEPSIRATNDPKQVAAHYLLVARLLYQAGSLDGSELFYQKIPNGTAEYLQAREELTWIWLRKGDLQNLRGQLKTLKSELFRKYFAPEVYVVRAISSLKLCFFDETEKDFKEFQEVYAPWAKRIDQALKKEGGQAIDADEYVLAARRAVELRQKELTELEKLSQASITAVLPAVGPQSHWTHAKNQVSAELEAAKKLLAEEQRRQARNQHIMLSEAIRKMHFVKVELLSQIRRFSNTSISTPLPVSAIKKTSNDEVFPFDGVLWPDELFKLKSLAQSRCLSN